MAASQLGEYALHPARRSLRVLAVACLEPGDDAVAVFHVAVLAELELGLDARERHVEGDDTLGLRFGIARRQALEAPGLRAVAFIDSGQPGQHVERALGVLDGLRPAVGMHRDVIPSRHLYARRVPGRRDISVWPPEQRQ